MTWEEGPAPQSGAAVQVFDVGFLRHAMVDAIEDPDPTFSESYAESPYGAGPRRVARLCRFRNGEAIGSPWHAEVGTPPADSP